MARSFSAAAVAQFFAQDADDPLILLVTITAPNDVPGDDTLRLANGWTTRLTSLETDESKTVYGVTSNGNDYIYLPLEIALPSSDDAAPRATITIHDVTRYVVPLIRGVTDTPDVQIDAVLASAPNTVEMSITGLQMSNIDYDQDTITATLVADDLALEPFPCDAFDPSHFPGMF